MGFLSKSQIIDMIRNRPPGTSPEGIVAALRTQGHQLEGYPEQPEQKSFLGKIGDVASALTPDFIEKPVVGVVKDAAGRLGEIGETIAGVAKGEKNVLLGGLRVAGQTAGFAGDVAGRGLEAAGQLASTITPDFIENPVVEGVKAAGLKILQTPLGQSGLQAIQGGMETYGQWKQQNPDAAAALEDVVNIASLLPITKVAKAGGKVAMEGAESVTKAAGKVIPAVTAVPKAALAKAKVGLRKANARFANIGDDVLERAYQNPDGMEQAINAVLEAPEQPFKNLATNAGTRLLQLEKEAAQNFDEAKNAWKQTAANDRFDISQNLDRIVFGKPTAPGQTPQVGGLKKFNLGLQRVDQGTDGKLRIALKQGKAKPFTPQEMKNLEEMTNIIANAKAFGVDDLLDMNKTFDKFYDAVRLTEKKTAKPYHAAVMTLKDGFDEVMQQVLPVEMKEAYMQLARSNKLLKNWGGKLLEGEASGRRVSQSAESFISSLGHLNRGQRKQYIKELENALGIDLTDQVDLLNDARKLAKIAASTGGRQGDIIKSLIVPMIGGALGTTVAGGLGSVAGYAAGATLQSTLSSPIKAARRQIKAGRKAMKNVPAPK